MYFVQIFFFLDLYKNNSNDGNDSGIADAGKLVIVSGLISVTKLLIHALLLLTYNFKSKQSLLLL